MDIGELHAKITVDTSELDAALAKVAQLTTPVPKVRWGMLALAVVLICAASAVMPEGPQWRETSAVLGIIWFSKALDASRLVDWILR
jgi:hypothetical protein